MLKLRSDLQLYKTTDKNTFHTTANTEWLKHTPLDVEDASEMN